MSPDKGCLPSRCIVILYGAKRPRVSRLTVCRYSRRLEILQSFGDGKQSLLGTRRQEFRNGIVQLLYRGWAIMHTVDAFHA